MGERNVNWLWKPTTCTNIYCRAIKTAVKSSVPLDSRCSCFIGSLKVAGKLITFQASPRTALNLCVAITDHLADIKSLTSTRRLVASLTRFQSTNMFAAILLHFDVLHRRDQKGYKTGRDNPHPLFSTFIAHRGWLKM